MAGSKKIRIREIGRKMLDFFRTYEAADGAPSFPKFAHTIGCSAGELLDLRSDGFFDGCFRECLEIRRDFLTDQALLKRFDPSFVKFLLSEDPFADEQNDASALSVTVEVIGSRESSSQDHPETKSVP